MNLLAKISIFLCFVGTLQTYATNPLEAIELARSALNNLDPCERQFVIENVLKQGPVFKNSDFHSFRKTLERFKIAFDSLETTEHVISVDPEFTTHRVLVIHTLKRGEIETEYMSVEKRIGIPSALAERIDSIKKWPLESDGEKFGVITEGQSLTLGAAHLNYLRLAENGYAELLEKEGQSLIREGLLIQEEKALAAIRFYLKQIERRTWSSKFRTKLIFEFWEYLDQSTLMVTKDTSKNKVIGTLQSIRIPYGIRVVAKGEKSEDTQAVDLGIWGDSVRRLADLPPQLLKMSDLELSNWMYENYRRGGKLAILHTPVEAKMNAQGLKLHREIFTEQVLGTPITLNDGKPGFVFFGSAEIDEDVRFAIDPEYNPRIFVEVLVHGLATSIDPNFSDAYNQLHRLHVTYNDHPGLYFWAGYRLTGQTLVYDGQNFKILAATGRERMNALLLYSKALKEEDDKALAAVKDAATSSNPLGTYVIQSSNPQ